MKSDIEIAQSVTPRPIAEIAEELNIPYADLVPYGHDKAKVTEAFMRSVQNKPDGKLILVTAINPTPAGEGKTTTSVGLGQAMQKIGKKAICALREPSLGPVFGIKGGAAGGGYAQVIPMEDINLHFTGDMHAITAANNLLCAVLDNHLQQGNALSIDPRRILLKRCLDMNDRALRNIHIGFGGPVHGMPREDSFQITVASEVMAILCLAEDLEDLKRRLGDILVGFTYQDQPIYARDLGVEGAMAALLKDAIQPNLVQTLEHTPVIMHGGPFANIAHGCNSVRATKLALKLADYTITEAGFGADLGAEKFLDIKCRAAGLRPDCVVLVATVRALKYNGGVLKDQLADENVEALRAGLCNLGAHLENLKKFGLPVVVAVNRFHTDTDAELSLLTEYCEAQGSPVALAEVFAKGGEGGVELAKKVVEICDSGVANFHPLYDEKLPLKEKMDILAREIYGADEVIYTAAAEKALKKIQSMGLEQIPVCVAKTQYSLSDDPTLLGRPSGFAITVRDIRVSAGAGFLVVLTGDIMTMPGLPKQPAALKIDIAADGKITGLF